MKPKCVNCGHTSTDHAWVSLEQKRPNCQKCNCKEYIEELESSEDLFKLHWEKRRTKLAKILATKGVDNPTATAQFIMECNFDYVPYIAARAAVETIRRNKEKLGVTFD